MANVKSITIIRRANPNHKMGDWFVEVNGKRVNEKPVDEETAYNIRDEQMCPRRP